MAKSAWPISPTFLSLSSARNRNEENADYNIDGIYYTDYIRGFLADLSHDKDVQNALSIFQFVPETFVPLDNNAEENIGTISSDSREATVLLNTPVDPLIQEILGKRKIIRIDSGTFINNGELCDSFRRDGQRVMPQRNKNIDFCFRRDSVVGLFADSTLLKYDVNTKEYISRLQELVDYLNNNREITSKIQLEYFDKEGENRLYVHYSCPVSLFEENIFPIYAQGRVIACLMLGQMARKSFDLSNTFYGYRDKMKDKKGELVDFESIHIDTLDDNEWNRKVSAIVERIQVFEKRLEDKLNHRNIKYINDEFDNIEKVFTDRVRRVKIKSPGVFKKFFEALSDAFTSIRGKFDNSEEGFIRMFALPMDTDHEKLMPIGWSDATTKVGEYSDFYFSVKLLNGANGKDDQKQTDVILNSASPRIKDKYDSKKDVFLCGSLAGDEVSYIVWKRHSKELKKHGNLGTFKEYKKSLRNFYAVALQCYSYIRGARMEMVLETTIRASTHESSHFILPAINIVQKSLNLPPDQMILSKYAKEYNELKQSFELYRDEVLELLQQLHSINTRPSIIFADVEVKKRKEKVFYVLYKLKKMMNHRANDGCKNICYDQYDNYVEANIDVLQFNHALFNLLDNAIKYGYEGSNIYIVMDVDKLRNILRVKVISYGIKIEDDYDLYGLFERGTTAMNFAKGMGIGMYIVKKICKAHGGEIYHSSKKMSKFDIPVLFNYKKNKKLAKNCSESEIIEFDDELSRLSDHIEKEVVYDSRYVKYATMFTSRIYNETYKNSFVIELPL